MLLCSLYKITVRRNLRSPVRIDRRIRISSTFRLNTFRSDLTVIILKEYTYFSKKVLTFLELFYVKHLKPYTILIFNIYYIYIFYFFRMTANMFDFIDNSVHTNLISNE